jgi:hypothetical protein
MSFHEKTSEKLSNNGSRKWDGTTHSVINSILEEEKTHLKYDFAIN